MRIFGHFHEAYAEIERDLFEMGIRVHPNSMQDKDTTNNPDFDTIEIQDYLYSLTSWRDLQEAFAMEGWNYNYVLQEVADRISGEDLNPGNSWLLRAKTWEQFLEPGGRFAYTYPERMHYQLMNTLDMLRRDPDSRQAIVTIYDQHLDMRSRGGKRRVPCSMHYQFMVRRDQVHLSYVMRSCDLYTHFPYDVAIACKLCEYAAAYLGMEPGHFKHYIGSLHIYRKDAREGIF